ncbi:MAG: DUF6498-containing protein, partial [Planctomycetota bacterium]|nr:DUF6498-containing protein [Planctomycetota bacterium]
MSLDNSLEKKQPVLAKNEINEKDRECILVACWYVAFADGRLYREANLMRSIAQRLQINQKTSHEIKKLVARGELLPEFPSGLAGKKLMFKLVLDVATSDGHLKLAEIESIRRIGVLAGLEKGEIDRELEALGGDAKGENNLVNKGENSHLDSHADCSHDDSGLEQSLQRLVASEASGAVAAKSPLTSLVLILWGNVAPALGVLFLDWRVFSILLVFWLENIIIGMINAAKMSWASGNQSYGKNAMPVWFFCLHFGGFCLVHGIFVFVVF